MPAPALASTPRDTSLGGLVHRAQTVVATLRRLSTFCAKSAALEADLRQLEDDLTDLTDETQLRLMREPSARVQTSAPVSRFDLQGLTPAEHDHARKPLLGRWTNGRRRFACAR